ncbi:uncharacterized protein [Triticum aestivum]|uniref:uncharacterized protein n=1 Tax=Triticum aestivum TaxID=4565 RepID=UPI001D008231|nr:uncharacterized protein LOC123115833 [Triticum aestivum]
MYIACRPTTWLFMWPGSSSRINKGFMVRESSLVDQDVAWPNHGATCACKLSRHGAIIAFHWISKLLKISHARTNHAIGRSDAATVEAPPGWELIMMMVWIDPCCYLCMLFMLLDDAPAESADWISLGDLTYI